MMTVHHLNASKANAHKLSLVTFNLGNIESTPFWVPGWYSLLKLTATVLFLSQFLWCISLTFQKVWRIPRKSVDASALSQVLFIFACFCPKLFQVRAAIWSGKVGAEDIVFMQHMFQGILIWRSSSWTHELKTPWVMWGYLGSPFQYNCYVTTLVLALPDLPSSWTSSISGNSWEINVPQVYPLSSCYPFWMFYLMTRQTEVKEIKPSYAVLLWALGDILGSTLLHISIAEQWSTRERRKKASSALLFLGSILFSLRFVLSNSKAPFSWLTGLFKSFFFSQKQRMRVGAVPFTVLCGPLCGIWHLPVTLYFATVFVKVGE